VEDQNNDGSAADGSSRQPDPMSDEPEDAGPRPGMHPEVKRSGTSRSTALMLAVFLALGALLYAAIALGIAGSG
jgi:hypothetical protein